MLEFLAKKIKNHKELVLYVFFGGLTTFVSITGYFIFRFFFGVKVSQIFSWLFAVVFAYVTNKLFVFESHQDRLLDFFKEFFMFVCARLFTGIMEFILLIILVNENTMSLEKYIKIAVTVIVIIVNYLLSKILVFAKNT